MVQVVWDAGQQGTACGRSGDRVSVGGGAAFSSEDLLGLAAATCLMSGFLTVAEQHDEWPLSYLSIVEVTASEIPGLPPHVGVRIFITADTEASRRRLETFVPIARHNSPIAYLLGSRLDLHAEFHVLPTPPLR